MTLTTFLTSLSNILTHPCNKGRVIQTLLKLIWWKLNQRFFNLSAIVELIPGVYCICPAQSSSGSLIVYTRLHEYAEMTFWSRFIEPSDTVFDVGANLGDYSLIAGSTCSKGQTFAFEPLPEIFTTLKQNVCYNQLTERITLVNEAAAHHNRGERFVIAAASEMSHLQTGSESASDKIINVKTVTLDSFCHQHKIKVIDLLHLDVEGGELSVLQGATKLLRKRAINYILLETLMNTAEQQQRTEAVLALLKANEYDLYVFDERTHQPSPLSMPLSPQYHNVLAVNPSSKTKRRLKRYINKYHVQ